MKCFLIVINIFLLFIVACVKVPEKFDIAQLKVNVKQSNKQKKYELTVRATLTNENNNIVFVNYKANVVLKNKKGKIIEKIPFEVKNILPYASIQVVASKTVTGEILSELKNEFIFDEEKLHAAKSVDNISIDEKNIELENIYYKKENILDLLKGKLNEKN